jgi:tetratricopeptide (TPR) repeat protein
MLLTFIFYLKSLDLKRASLYLLTAVSYTLALLSRENALILPLAILFYHYAFKRKIELKNFLLVGILSFLYIILRATVFKALFSQDPASTTLLQRVPGFFAAFAVYLKILVLPFDLHMEYGDRLFVFTQPQVLIGMLLFVLIAAYGFKKRSKDPLVFFSLGWFLIFLFPHANLYPINAYMSEHWLYLPSIGLFLVIAKGLSGLFKNKRLRVPAVLAFIFLLGSYSFLTFRQNTHWLDPAAFYKRILRYTPASYRVYNNLGKAYASEGKVDLAVEAYRKSIELKPDYPEAFFNLGNMHRDLGDLEKAEELYRRALELDPFHTDAYTNLGVIYSDLKQTKKAIDLYKKAIEANPDNLEAYNNLGNAYSELGEYDQAIVFFGKAISLKLNIPETYFNIGNAYRLTGRLDEAVAAYRQAIELNPGYPEIYNNLGICFYSKRDYRQAIAAYKKAVALKSDYAAAYSNLGNAYRNIKDNGLAIKVYKKAIQVDPVHATSHNNLAVAYFDEQEFDLAVEYADKALKLGYPVNPRFLEMLAPYREAD